MESMHDERWIPLQRDSDEESISRSWRDRGPTISMATGFQYERDLNMIICVITMSNDEGDFVILSLKSL